MNDLPPSSAPEVANVHLAEARPLPRRPRSWRACVATGALLVGVASAVTGCAGSEVPTPPAAASPVPSLDPAAEDAAASSNGYELTDRGGLPIAVGEPIQTGGFEGPTQTVTITALHEVDAGTCPNVEQYGQDPDEGVELKNGRLLALDLTITNAPTYSDVADIQTSVGTFASREWVAADGLATPNVGADSLGSLCFGGDSWLNTQPGRTYKHRIYVDVPAGPGFLMLAGVMTDTYELSVSAG